MIVSFILESILLLIPYVFTLNPLSLKEPVTHGFGIQIHFTHPKADEMEMLAAAGFKWVRMDFYWDSIEKKKGEYNFKDYELLMSELEKHNMSAVFELTFSNPLYEKSTSVVTEEGRKAYAKWAATGVEHFKGREILWEVWNEPNGAGFWGGHPDVQQYVAMALEAVKAIRAKSPNELIIGPATSGVDLKFLEECFKAGLLNYWDAVSVHPYRQTEPETAYSNYNYLKTLIAKYAPKGKTIPIISSEWGYSTVWKNFDEKIQAKYLPRELLSNVMNGIPVSIWYDWHDDGTNQTDPEHHFGIVNNAYSSQDKQVYKPKEAYLSAKTLNSVLWRHKFVKRIATEDPNDYVLLFDDVGILVIAAWTTTAQHNQIKLLSDDSGFEFISQNGSIIYETSTNTGSLFFKLSDTVQYIKVKHHNQFIRDAPEFLFNVAVMPVHAKEIGVKIYNIKGLPINGTIKLIDIKGINSIEVEQKFQFQNEFEKVVNFSLKSIPDNDISVGLEIITFNNIQKFKAQNFHFLPKELLSDCKIWAEGDSKIQSEQSISIHSAPQPLFDSDFPVLKLDYHFFGQGWKYLNVNPVKNESRKISGQPKAFGIWVYGDNQKISIMMRFDDSTHQTFQIKPDSRLTIDWIGWRYVLLYLNNVDAHWGGADDCIFHYPIEWHTLFMLDNVIHANTKSTVYISTPVIIY
jgi:hypothetical protein